MITVVVVTFNSENCVGACIDAVSRWLPNTETLVIDNASTDASREVAQRHGATVIASPENVGFGRACNLGARRARHDHILFLNPDVAITSADVDGLASLLDSKELGLVVPASTGSSFMFKERSWPGDAVSLTLGTLRPRELARPSPSGRGSKELWACGAALLVRRSEFRDVGGFDASFFLYYEDRDLSWRYRKRGLPLRSTTALAAEHVGGGSSKIEDDRAEILAFAILGWLQYVYNVYGPKTAARAWRLAFSMHAAIEWSVGAASQVRATDRLRRKSLQLKGVSEMLRALSASSGRLAYSDGCAYWPDAITLLGGG
jgi:N-acetylglucosaminyl-diphospho-decaprenol L-rhamnosyltransferase